MKPFTIINNAMRRYNNSVAHGSECSAWQDFVADTYANFGQSPWYVAGELKMADNEWADYWFDVAAGKSKDYEPDTGARS